MRTFIAPYIAYGQFNIGSKIPLLSPKENYLVERGTPWSWWIRRTTLYYYDGAGVEHEIHSGSDLEVDLEYPEEEKIYSDDDGQTESESDSDDEHPCKDCGAMGNWQKCCWCEYCDKHTCFECDPTKGGRMYGAICPQCFNDGVHIADNYGYDFHGDDEELKISELFWNCILTDDY